MERMNFDGTLSAEMALLGAVLISPHVIERVNVQDSDFLYPNIAEVYAVVKRQYVRGKNPDLVTVKSELGGGDQTEDLLLRAMESCVHASNVEHYAEQVREFAYLRRFHEWRDTLAKAESVSDIESAMSKRPLMYSSSDLLSIGSVEMPTHSRGVPTGLSALDYLTHGAGWVCGQMGIVSAYHKTGKTAFLTQTTRAGAETGESVYGTFADLDPRMLLQRMLIQDCGSRYAVTDMEQAALGNIRALPIAFYWSKKHGRFVEDFCAKMRSYAWKRPIVSIYVDYAQKLRTKGDWGSTEREQAAMAAQLVDLAEDLDVPVVVASQITKDKEGGVITKHGRVWEEEAGIVVRIERKIDSTEAKIDVPFNRHGPARKIDCVWNERLLKFELHPMESQR